MLRAFAALCATLLCGVLTSGCFAVPVVLAHDQILGPLSPAGNVRGASTGDSFEVTQEGIVAVASEQIFRPYSKNILSRMIRPVNIWGAAQGLQAAVGAISPLVWRTQSNGTPLDPEKLEGIQLGTTSRNVLKALGAPNLWIRRKTGSMMGYRAELTDGFSLYVGMPPLVGQLNPIPGLGNISFRYTSSSMRPHKTLLFFDAEDRLLAVSTNESKKQQVEE